jgi:hypothetical protein
VSLAGRLEEVDLAELLHFLALYNRTGKVTLTRRDGHGLVVVREGRIVYAASSSIRETFGNILVGRGLVSPETLAVALERQHASGDDRKLGFILMEMGSLTEDQLNDVLKQQAALVVQEMFRWRAGYFKFEVVPVASSGEIGVDAEDLVVTGGVATDQVLLEAMTRMDEEEVVEAPDTARSIATAALSPALRAENTVGLLRRAGTVVKRAVLFVLRGDELHGAGQLGFDVDSEPEDHAHGIRLPMADSSVITAAADRRETWQGEIPRTEANERLLGLLGGDWPKRAVVVPLMVREGVGLVLYGDSGLEDRALGPVEELEWALLEAGLSMERDLLEARLRAFEQARGYRP